MERVSSEVWYFGNYDEARFASSLPYTNHSPLDMKIHVLLEITYIVNSVRLLLEPIRLARSKENI